MKTIKLITISILLLGCSGCGKYYPKNSASTASSSVAKHSIDHTGHITHEAANRAHEVTKLANPN